MKQVEVIKATGDLMKRTFGKVIDRLRVAAYCRVSTDSIAQLGSYESQIDYYTDYINSNPEWVFAGVYADDETGTQTKGRDDFNRLISESLNGDVDMIVTKTVGRFARNTVDTLSLVRKLKEKNIAVFFEGENINTLTMDGELLLTILSAVAQQEVVNTSTNVKKGLKMKMSRGELVGFQGCLGYDYDKESKSININEAEAEIIRYIFDRYIEGMGCFVIARELERLGHKTKRGNSKWSESTVLGIVKNEKYKGDIRQGKTFTVDPISKRRLENFGEEDQFYIHKNHEPIISDEMFEKVQRIIERRSVNRKSTDGKREKYSRKYAFSSMLECGFCGSNLSRRSWHSGTQYHKTTWQCIINTKKGKKFCPDAKGISEETIEKSFLESYKILCYNRKDVIDDLLKHVEEALCSENSIKELSRAEKEISAIEQKRKKLVNMHLDDVIDRETYENKYADLNMQLSRLTEKKESIKDSANLEIDVKQRISDFRKVLEGNEVITDFDRYVFESIVEKVIIGGVDDDGNKDPSMLTFIYKTGSKNNIKGKDHKPERKNSKGKNKVDKLCSKATNEVNPLSSYSVDDTCGGYSFTTKAEFH